MKPAKRWKQPIRIWFKTRRLARDAHSLRIIPGWEKAHPADASGQAPVLEFELPVGLNARAAYVGQLASHPPPSFLTSDIESYSIQSSDQHGVCFGRLFDVQYPCELAIGMLLQQSKGSGAAGALGTTDLEVVMPMGRPDANFIIDDVGCWDPRSDGASGKTPRFEFPPALLLQGIREVDVSIQYYLCPFATVALYSIEDEIVGTSILLFYGPATFVQECRQFAFMKDIADAKGQSLIYETR
jgi:hypothetical protein